MNKYFDIIIVGSGIAGLSYALKASKKASVAIITKKNRAESNTNYAQGGIASVTSEEDDFTLHVKDTLNAGAGLCNEKIVKTCVAEGPPRIQDLIQLGVQFSERENSKNNELDLGKEGGHTKRRVLHAADMTGKEVERALIHAIEKNPNIHVFENTIGIDLIVKNRQCLGLYALNIDTNTVETFSSKITVLATGGCGKSYLYTTNPDIATGDGVAMAFRAGASVSNMEFIQFHPTCLYHPFAKSFLISEALRGEGARLINAKGNEFAHKYSELAALAPRDIVARAIDAEIKRSGKDCVYLDISHRGKEFIENRFPNIYQYCLSLGIDAAKEPIPVVPAAHYQCGGITAGLNGQTTIPGLYAIGEVAFTGLHGANRLASNSLLEALVMATQASHTSLQELDSLPDAQSKIELPEWQEGNAADPDELVVVSHNWKEIRQLMWDYVGIVRTTKRLERARNRLQILNREIQAYYWDFKVTSDLLELRNLVLISSLIVESALSRKESRGLHFTLDYPQSSSELLNTHISSIPWLEI